MKTLFCKLFSLAIVGTLAAAPAVADSAASFRLDQPVQVGSVMLPAGVYLFRASDRGVVSVFDNETSRYVAIALSIRQPGNASESDSWATLTHDWAVRTLNVGKRSYRLSPGKPHETLASRQSVSTTVIALTR